MGTQVRLPALVAQVMGRAAGMGTRARRRRDLVLLAIGGLLVGGAAAVGAAVGDSERVTGLWAGAVIGRDGRAGVVEVIDYDFGVRHRHGIFRDVPGLSPDVQVTVSSATAPAGVQLDSTGSETRIRIGDPSRTITGRQRYKIAYPLDDVAPQGRLVWDAVGTGWPVAVGNVEVHVVAPFELGGAGCGQGAGALAPCEVGQPEPGHLVATISALQPGEGVTLYATGGRQLGDVRRLPVPSSGLPVDATSGLLLAGLVAGAAALVGAAPSSWLLRRAGRERVAVGGAAGAASADAGGEVRVDAGRLGSLATIEFTPPAELTPAQGGVVLAEAVREEHKVAWLIGAAMDGYLDLEEDGQVVTLVRLPRHDGSWTARTLDTAFAAGDDRLTLGSYDSNFAAAWRRVGDELAAWQRTCGLWDPAGDFHRTLARVLGAALAVGGLAIAGVGGALANRWGWVWLALMAWGALLAGAGLAAVVCAWELRVRTAVGSGLWLRVESFRRFLAASEAHHAEEAAKHGVLRQYTAWAVAVGELGRWSRTVAASATAVDPAGARYSRMAPWLPAAALASTVAPSSSGSGDSSGGGGWSGGGDSSGGGGGGGDGGGGGGGGSW
jgi:hypothetical protein